jgi:DNA-binding LacI/PurR family transcriptional regulator
VSQKTVSRVFNSEPHVSVEVRKRVLAAARELGYRRNLAAAELTRGRSRRIGVVSLGSSLWGPATVLVAIERGVRAAGYSFTLVNTLEGAKDGIARAMQDLLEQGVDGIVLCEPIDDEYDLAVVDAPILSIGRTSSIVAPHVIVAGVDGVAGGRAATEHLLSLGHRTVSHIAGPQRWFSAQDRLSGWRQALEAAGSPLSPVVEGDWSPASGYAAALTLMKDRSVTALFAANDDMAVGALRAFRDHGVDVPRQISVLGYDDVPVAAYVEPPLTTVRQDFAAEVDTGLARLFDEIEGRAGEDQLIRRSVPVQLIVRQSTAPADHPPAAEAAVPRTARNP